jgi:Flp pilus assembly protein TadD
MVGETQARNPALLHAAQQNLENLARSEPDNPHVHAALGRIFKEAGLTEKAQAAFARVLALDPANPEATGALAELKASGSASR